MFMSRHQNAERNYNLMMGNKSFETVTEINTLDQQYLLSYLITYLLNRPLLPCGVEGFLLVNL
jgi:hypothetical protein